jgi:hypothetical protein
MDTHSMIFVTIDKLVSPSSSVDGDPLDDFPDHWQPHFSAGGERPAPSKRKICPVSASSDSQAVISRT